MYAGKMQGRLYTLGDECREIIGLIQIEPHGHAAQDQPQAENIGLRIMMSQLLFERAVTWQVAGRWPGIHLPGSEYRRMREGFVHVQHGSAYKKRFFALKSANPSG